MATAKMETAAQKYRRKSKEKLDKSRILEAVVCDDPECGMEWQCERQAIDFWIVSGILPTGMVETMIKATKKGGDTEQAVRALAADKVIQSIAFSNKVVLHTAIDPKIVDKDPEECAENEISREELMMCCYKKLLSWQTVGGDGAAVLETFR